MTLRTYILYIIFIIRQRTVAPAEDHFPSLPHTHRLKLTKYEEGASKSVIWAQCSLHQFLHMAFVLFLKNKLHFCDASTRGYGTFPSAIGRAHRISHFALAPNITRFGTTFWAEFVAPVCSKASWISAVLCEYFMVTWPIFQTPGKWQEKEIKHGNCSFINKN